MPDDDAHHPAISFGQFRLFPNARRLEKDGTPISIGGRALDILTYLAERPGVVVDKRELLKQVWADVNVDEGSLRFHITTLRKAIGDGADGTRYVVNVPGRGYCFTPSLSHVKSSHALPVDVVKPVHPLPAPPAKMVGRTDAIEKISADLSLHRFVSIVGPGGIGKTSVAIAVAHGQLQAFKGQVFFIDFGALRDASLVPSAIASTLGLKVSSEDPLPGLLAFLQGRRILLIFDSCEHVVDTLTPLAERMIGELPDLHVLATTRESFRAENERIYRLFPLVCPPPQDSIRVADLLAYPAAQLFVERVAATLGEFRLAEEEAPLVAEICQRLEGIALAIELAAGRVQTYGIMGTASLLNSRFSLLWRGRRTAIPRHQTLSAALGWSYDLLSPAESATLRGLSVFVGPFTLAAARAVVPTDELNESEVVEAIASLLSKSLLATLSERPSKFRLLDTTRAFVVEKLAESGGADRAARAHAEYFRNLLNEISAKSTGQQSDGGFLAHADQVPNVRAALNWSFSDRGDRATGIDLAATAAQFFLELSLLTECYDWTQKAIQALQGASKGGRQEMELQAALGTSAMFTQGNTEAVRTAFTRSLHLAEQLGDRNWQFWLLRVLHIYYTRIGDFQGTQRASQQGEAVAKVLADPSSTLNVEWMLGGAHHLIGNQRKAVDLCESAMARNPISQRPKILHLGFDDRILALVALARGLWLTGRPDRALEAARYTIGEAERLEQPLSLSLALLFTIPVFLWTGDWEEAESMIHRFIDHTSRHSLVPHLAVANGFRGELLIRRGDTAGGIEHLERSQAKLYAIRYRLMTTVFATVLAEARAQQGQPEEALRLVEEAMAQIGDHGESFDMPEILRIKGHAFASSGRLAEAESCLRQSLELARKQQALGWELRAAVTLGRLWHGSGRPEDARALVEPLYGRYKEGLDSADLVAARHFLNALN
ncbi:winged helix-turn-helix domain-containing protein [Bradyrhizobium sp. Pear77]|uniref:ATP-binding protein n=1 Tax=Bradyrhizobium altum TaxID=1571202 RepID=UPI00289B79BF|nr:winged helix-turn-helix domain-containing protein [Bradyrhizobium altum]MCC8953265.1 winged helix-turn-helix domain-containing protein [Bradyrhizobium altum]